MSDNIISLSPENFQQVVLEDSKNINVLVAFWAEQIPESVELRDKLINALSAHGQSIKLALVDCQSQQAIAQQFGIQALPTAVLVQSGQPIDGISGPQTDETITSFLEKYLPKAEDTLLQQGQQFLLDDNAHQALEPLLSAIAIDGERADIKLALADVYVQTGKLIEAEQLIATIMMVDQDSYYQSIVSKLELAQNASNSPELQSLEQAHQNNPDDVELTQKLAVQYSQVNRQNEALELLYGLMLSNRSDESSKKILLDILAALPSSDPLTIKYRRKLFSLMY